ncbi:MAG: mechanosensitive ion channel family protein [Lachnospiraceae bacterium]|nr:mechanosensitive ion channel family protein [Lachnospiraceae bacterium]
MLLLDATEATDLGTAVENPGVIMKYLEDSVPVLLSFLVQLIIAILVLIIGGKLIKWIVKLVRKSLDKSRIEDSVSGFLCSLIKYALYFVLVMVVLSQFGLTTGSVVAVLGSAGLTLGLSFQGSLSNFAGGVLILLLKPFKVGDYILEKASGLEGTVSDITIFYTKLTTVDNKEVSVPNGNLSNNSIINYTKNDKRRVDINVAVAYDSDLKEVKAVLENVARSHELVLLDEPIDAFVAELEDSGIKMELRAWCATANYWKVKWDLTENVKKSMDEAGVNIPFPQLDVKIRQ